MVKRTWRRVRANSSSQATTPPSTSPWPPRYLVALCSTMRAPKPAGRWRTGVAKVLSASSGTVPQAWATARRSISARVGLAGVSTRTRPVSGRDGVGDAGRVDPGDLRAEQPGVQQVVAAPVQRAHRDDVAQAEGGAGQQDGGEGGHAAGEGDGGLGPLQPGEGGLEAADGGVAEAGVDGRALQLGAGGGEGVEPGGLGTAVVGGVGGGEVERRRVQAEGGEVVAARVDGFRGQGPGCGRRRGGGVRGVVGHGPRVRGRPAVAAKPRATFAG
ncbi:hypothetical protein M2168_005690 [Streptomyces sp. CZ24]|nr:hypothetical protein [Streptomyces sp. CZ24]